MHDTFSRLSRIPIYRRLFALALFLGLIVGFRHLALAGVTLGLLHGSQPDALVLCHDPSRSTIEGYPDCPIPDLQHAIDRYVEAARLTNRAVRCVGISINSSTLSDADWQSYARTLAQRMQLPVVDPMRGGVDALAEALTGR